MTREIQGPDRVSVCASHFSTFAHTWRVGQRQSSAHHVSAGDPSSDLLPTSPSFNLPNRRNFNGRLDTPCFELITEFVLFRVEPPNTDGLLRHWESTVLDVTQPVHCGGKQFFSFSRAGRDRFWQATRKNFVYDLISMIYIPTMQRGVHSARRVSTTL